MKYPHCQALAFAAVLVAYALGASPILHAAPAPQRFKIVGAPDAEEIADARGRAFQCALVKAGRKRVVMAGRVARRGFLRRAYGRELSGLAKKIETAPKSRIKKLRRQRKLLLAARAALDKVCKHRRTNEAPLAISQTLATPLDTPLRLKLIGNDADRDALEFSITAPPAHGNLSGSLPDLVYTPDAAYYGEDSFQFTVSDGRLTSNPGAVTVFVGGWQPPIGIPMPPFGIAEAAPEYDLSNPLHYYVNGPGGCSNSNNGARGSPDAPLCMIPKTLPAGAYVEVHGGPYSSSPFLPVWSGTAEAPIFIKGVDMPRFDKAFVVYNDAGGGGSYVIIDGLSFHSFQVGNNYHHLALRNSDLHGDADSGGVSLHANKTDALVHHVVLYNNVIHDNGIWDPKLARGDRDIHGIGIGWYCKVENVWILDSEIFHNEGDAVQINAGPNAPNSNVNRIFIGRNIFHHNKQSGVALKSSDDVIVSQNNIYGHRRSSSAMGPGIGFSDNGPERAWFIFNRLHDNEIGIKMNSGASPGPYYLLGNLIYNIHAFTDGSFKADDAYHLGQAVVDWHPAKKYFVGNTIYDADGGYGHGGWNWGSAKNLIAVNNIFSGMSGGAHSLNIEDPAAAQAAQLEHNLFGGPFSVQWGEDRIYTSLAALQTATGKGSACLAADPGFSDPGNADFHLHAGSAARDGGSDALVEQLAETFLARYGMDIRKDLDGRGRPQGAAWDIGAYEF